jgi:hypothetical protein
VVADSITDGLVLGVDVGFSPKQRSTCFCTLSWDRVSALLDFRLTTCDPSERRDALDTIVEGRRLAGVALDGPLANGLRHVSHYRSAEAILSRGILQKRGKPGQTSAPVGQELHGHATELAALVVRRIQVDSATHVDPIVRERVVEAFPNMYLAALVNERDLHPLARNASDVYWRSLVETSSKLAYHIDQLLPGRSLDADLASITDHDHRAGVVCALTALSVTLDRHVAVGDAVDGDIMLPAEADWGSSAAAAGSWLEPVLRTNLSAVRAGEPANGNFKNARITGMS